MIDTSSDYFTIFNPRNHSCWCDNPTSGIIKRSYSQHSFQRLEVIGSACSNVWRDTRRSAICTRLGHADIRAPEEWPRCWCPIFCKQGTPKGIGECSIRCTTVQSEMNNYFAGCLHRRTLFTKMVPPWSVVFFSAHLSILEESCWILALTNLRNCCVARDCRAYIDEAFVIALRFSFPFFFHQSAIPQRRISQKEHRQPP